MRLFRFRNKLLVSFDFSSIFLSRAKPHYRINHEHLEEYLDRKEKGTINFQTEPYGSRFHTDYQRAASIFIKPEIDLKYKMEAKSSVLKTTESGIQEIRVDFTEYERKNYALVLQRYNAKTGKPLNNHFSFTNDEIVRLKDFLNTIETIPIKGAEQKIYTKESIVKIEDARKFIESNKDLVTELIGGQIDKSDLENLKHRKKQLVTFKRMLDDEDYFIDLCKRKNIKGKEKLWQEFFEKNDWIFGYGLSYIFTTGLDEKKLEQYVKGFDFNSRGKRVDAILKTRGIINSLCFAEIKHHKTELINHKKPYRADCWNISQELSGAISQIQKTVQKAVKSIETEIRITDKTGNPTKETLYLYNPKSFIVVGSLNEFRTDNGVNQEKFSSFELYRQNIMSPEIITFDELYERAKFIVESKKESI